MKTALLEIGTESLPARFILPALKQMESLAADMLKEERLAHGAVRAVGTPMRLALLIEGVADHSASQTREVLGPPARLLKDAQGSFTVQAQGFAKAQGVSPEELEVRQSPKGELLAACRVLPAEPAAKILARVFPRLIAAVEFPKGLEWEESRLRFGRPIRCLVSMLGKKAVPFTLAGVRAGAKSRGLAALGQKAWTVSDPDKYVDLLRERCVLVDHEERRKVLLKGLEQAARRSGGVLDADEALTLQVNFLCEHPVPVLCSFDKSYLELPQALLTTVLKTQLKFFPLLDRRGRLLPEFIGVRDGVSEGQKEVQTGYQRVLVARLSDAHFFFGRDRSTPLEHKRGKLSLVGFQKGLGSMLDKSDRVLKIAGKLCARLREHHGERFDEKSVLDIARLAYCDLVTDVVKEFPELQGSMGAAYARAEGLDERTALGLEEFYFPVQAKGALPMHREAVIASLAGKLDTVCAMLALGLKPSGSEDPFGLRRQGNAIVRIVLEKQLRISLPDIIVDALSFVEIKKREPVPTPSALGIKEDAPQDSAAKAGPEVREFLWQRAESLFLEQGFKQDEIRAVKESGLDDLPRTYKKLCALHSMRAEAGFSALAQVFKRASNIVKQAGDGASLLGVDRALLAEDAERALYEALGSVESDVRAKAGDEEFEAALRALVRIKPDLDLFFEKVLVMAEDPRVKANRLSLVARLVRLFRSVADVSQIQN
ncbi:MAG: glycine--tRNA ligase subunit beta [Elusimicrobiota bacterium]|jgi:glycyl-tRNA synthetase beta chain